MAQGKIQNKTLACWGVLSLALLLVLMQGCGHAPKREHPIPVDKIDQAQIPGVDLARMWGDTAGFARADLMKGLSSANQAWATASKAEVKRLFYGIMNQPHNYLAISGGGSDGAYGAGLLVGWTKTGTRPEFTLVTGVSTGALIAPFAFLGPDYDDELEQFYTTTTTKDIMIKRSTLSAINSDAAADSSPLKAKIQAAFDEKVIAAIGAEYKKGRRLYIGTTNLDVSRPVIWNIGSIAASGAPGAKDLIHEIILASASIPGAFPPVFIDVEVDGQTYDEMHVDGGTTSQVYIYPISMDFKVVKKNLHVQGQPRVFIIRNAKLAPEAETVPNKIFPIAGAAVSSLIRTQGIGDLYRIFLETRRDGLDYNLTYIPDNFDVESTEPFDTAYMNALFKVGHDMATGGNTWLKKPPCYKGCEAYLVEK